MFQNFFTDKCVAFVGDDGRALSGPALEAAKHNPQARHCGHLVKHRAKFCSKCGSPAPGGWWRCGACGQWIGNESNKCPHCGKVQNVSARLDLSDGVWQKGDDVFAQKFDSFDVQALLQKGLVIQEGQCAILLDDGVVAEVLPPGRYSKDDIVGMKNYLESGKAKSFVMVELSEIPFPVMVDSIRTKEDMSVDLRCVAVIQFNPEHPVEFLSNVMGARAYVTGGEVSSHLGYDDVARFIISDIDIASRDFCNLHTVDELFKDPSLRLDLENTMLSQLQRNLNAAGLRFIRLKEVEFQGAVFEHLREMAGDVETKRREIEFQLRADELANDASKRKAMSENEMEEFMDQLAQEKDIKDYMRAQEMARLADIWKFDRAQAEQDGQNHFETVEAEHAEELKSIQQSGELERREKAHAERIRQRIAEQNASLTYEQIEVEIQKMRVAAEQEAAKGWVDIQLQKQQGLQNLEFERINAYKDLDAKTLAAAIDDPNRADRIAHIAELELQKGMSPELLLAAAAARGVKEAADALSAMNSEQRAVIEKAREENRDIYEKMLTMNERMFNQAADSLAKGNAVPGTTIVK